MNRKIVLGWCLMAMLLHGCGEDSAGDAGGGGAGGVGTGEEELCFDSTYSLIQQEIFDAKGCTESNCHGAPADEAEGGLDLREGFSFDALVNVDGVSGNYPLVFPNDEEESLLYLKLQAKTGEVDLASLGISGGPMPAIGDALSEEELELIRTWIRGGARDGIVVPGTEDLIGCGGNVVADPNKIDPPPVPDVNEGVQFYSGGWALDPQDESEKCFVTYYDYSDTIPEDQQVPCDDAHGGPSRMCFTYNDSQLAQDPQSHHSIVEQYIPPADSPEQWDPNNEVWEDWKCLGGENVGQDCTPGGDECGPRSQCTTRVETTIACTAYAGGPEELGTIAGFFGTAQTRINLVTAQEASFRENLVDGVFSYMPVKGFVIWDSHGFNLNDKSTELEQWLTLDFAEPEDRQYRRQQIFDADDIFAMGVVAPFESREVCGSFTIPQFGRLLTLSSHTHRYGKRFRAWYPPNEPCEANDGVCVPPDRPHDYESRTYDDPLYQRFGQTGPLEFDSPDPADRSFRYCAEYENGSSNPLEVKRESGKPNGDTCDFIDAALNFIPPDSMFQLTQCGCPLEERVCLGGDNQGESCATDAECGDDGLCDACPMGPGVTTEDEMFILLGSYFVEQ